MFAWWDSLSLLQRVFAYAAIPSTVMLVVQTALVLFGLGDHDIDADADYDTDIHGGGDGLALFSIRGIIAFLSVGGWAGVAAAGAFESIALVTVLALAAGAAAMYSVALLFKLTARLQSSGNTDFNNAVGKTGKAYITIPKNGRGGGKVTLTFQGRFSECDAITEFDRDIKPGEQVRVTGLLDENTLIIAPIDCKTPDYFKKSEFEVEYK